jgi:lysophospholipase L1-like esterase
MFSLFGTIDPVKISHQVIYPVQIENLSFEIQGQKSEVEKFHGTSVQRSLFIPNHQIADAVSNPQKINADNENFNYSGRIDWKDPQAPAFGYPGTAVKFKFTGTSLKVELSEDNWGETNYVDVYLDDNPEPITIELQRDLFNGQPVVYDIAEGLENKVHNAVLVKRNDYVTGEFNFHGIIIDGEILAAEPDSQRTIEVYGDSISSGIAVEYEGTGVQDPEGNNNHLDNAYYSYASMLARHYNAELSIVAQAGVPLVNGYGYWNKFWHNGVGAEAIYDKVKPLPDATTWNFNKYTPDLVIIAYGQNDSGTIEIDKDLSSQEWKERYKQLLANLRRQYPNAYFIGMIPNMFHDSKWDAYVKEAIAEYSKEQNDKRVFSLIHQQVTPGHPRISEQKLMADTLIKFIDQTLTKHGFSW